MSERAQIPPAAVGVIFVAVAFVTILLLSLYYWFFNKIRKQTRLEKRVARRESAYDHDAMEEDLEMQEVPLDELKVPPKAMTRE